MFSQTPICPRCHKSVYAAEQIVGPGRKFYHKPCLTCTACKRRLDSYTLLEHDEQPYCKPCHLKNFATRDLRHAGTVPYAARPRSASIDDAPASPPSAPRSGVTPITTSSDGLPRLRPTRVLSPTSTTFPRIGSRPGSGSLTSSSAHATGTTSRTGTPVIREEDADTSVESSQGSTGSVQSSSTSATSASDGEDDWGPPKPPTSVPTNTGRPGLGQLPRTVPLAYDHGAHVAPPSSSRPPVPPKPKLPPRPGSAAQNPPSNTAEDELKAPSPPPRSPSPPTAPHSSYVPSSSYKSTSPYTSTKTTPGAAALSLLQREGISPPSSPLRQTPTGTGQRFGYSGPSSFNPSSSNNNSSSNPTSIPSIPVQMTGTRYGAALGGPTPLGVQMTGRKTQWGTQTPKCPKCAKSVYFAEQVRAVGKTYHKGCLRCTECQAGLDSNRLRDHDEEPFCVRCYNKLYGPQGSGYALLGKAGA